MNKFIYVTIALLTLNAYSADVATTKTDVKIKLDKTQFDKMIAEKSKDHPCLKDQASEVCQKLIKGYKDTFPCAGDVEKFCTDKEFKENGKGEVKDRHDAVASLKACLDKNKGSLSKACTDYQNQQLIKPYNCNDKCMELKNDKQLECMTNCITQKGKK